jgi:deoxyadenosine/deoxycytidine kinase
MASLITVIGNSGVGKTTLTRWLSQAGPFVVGLEQHQERPFQPAFSENRFRYSLHNQIDFFLLRAEQELFIRNGERPGIQDGGLEMDFFVFTRLFYLREYLTEAEYHLCERFYTFIREVLPPPDIILRLMAPLEVVARRYAQRNRALEIAGLEDLAQIEMLIEDWIGKHKEIPVLSVDATLEDSDYSEQIARILPQLRHFLQP